MYEYKKGLELDPITGKCYEICGDNINLDMLECEDGNRISGDGCSSDCKVEEGYQCNIAGCSKNYNVSYVTLNISNTSITIRFKEIVKFNSSYGNIEDIGRYIEFSYVNTSINDCTPLARSVQNPLKDNITEIIVYLKIECSINSKELMGVRFKVPDLFYSLDGRPLTTKSRIFRPHAHDVKSKQMTGFEIIGRVIRIVISSTVYLMLFLSFFQYQFD